MSPIPSPVHFGKYELELQSGELRKDGLKVRLAIQPLQVLTLLLEHPGEIVTREELRQRLWSSDTFVDFEHSLNAAVKRLREALCDSAEAPHYIETIPRQGYRLIAPLVRANTQATPAKAVQLSQPFIRSRQLHITLAVLSGILAGILGASYIPQTLRSLSQRFPAPIRSLAVLPLENLSGDHSQEYFSDGMTEVLITELSKVRSLRVISRRSVIHYKGTTKTLSEIARELKVDAIVEGSALRDGDRVRISAQLVRVNPEEHLWAQSYERDATNVLTLQREVTLAIVAELQLQLTPAEHRRIMSSRNPDFSAQDAFFRGLYEADKLTPQGSRNAVQLFERAIAIDPAYAMPHYGLSETFINITYAAAVAPSIAFPKAEAEAKKALELDQTLAEAHTVLGWVKAVYYWDWDNAEKEFKLAIEMNPASVSAHRRYGWFLTWIGRSTEGLTEARHASELDPLNPFCSRSVGIIFFCQRKYDQALLEWAKAIQIDPNSALINGDIGRAYIKQGRYIEAIAQFEKARALAGGETGGSATGGGYLGLAYALAGRNREASKLLDELLRRSQSDHVSPLNVAMIYMGLDNKDKAFEWLEKGFAIHDGDMVLLKVFPLWDPLRSDPRFAKLLTRMRFPS